jgi:adenosylcobinamide-GDP ribazoletransferase
MRDFITALQFLTRVHLVRKDIWAEGAFSRSLTWFPLVGALIGFLHAGAAVLCQPFDPLLRAVLLWAAELLLTGQTFTDGLMDTADGIFSGRERERVLEIMKDSRVGANGIIAFTLVSFLKIAVYQALPYHSLPPSLFAVSLTTKTAVVFAVTHFAGARSAGIAWLFRRYAKKSQAYKALLLGLILFIPVFSPPSAAAFLLTMLFSWAAARWLSERLSGLTGDTYGFIAETGAVFFLLTIYLFTTFIIGAI